MGNRKSALAVEIWRHCTAHCSTAEDRRKEFREFIADLDFLRDTILADKLRQAATQTVDAKLIADLLPNSPDMLTCWSNALHGGFTMGSADNLRSVRSTLFDGLTGGKAADGLNEEQLHQWLTADFVVLQPKTARLTDARALLRQMTNNSDSKASYAQFAEYCRPVPVRRMRLSTTALVKVHQRVLF